MQLAIGYDTLNISSSKRHLIKETMIMLILIYLVLFLSLELAFSKQSESAQREPQAVEIRNKDLSLSFSLMLNFGVDGKTHFLMTSEAHEYISRTRCNQKNQIFNPFELKCIKTDCPEGLISFDGSCVAHNVYVEKTRYICLDLSLSYHFHKSCSAETEPEESLKEILTKFITEVFRVKPESIVFPLNVMVNRSFCVSEKHHVWDFNAAKSPTNSTLKVKFSNASHIHHSKLITTKLSIKINSDEEVIQRVKAEHMKKGTIVRTFRGKENTICKIKGHVEITHTSEAYDDWCDGVKNDYIDEQMEVSVVNDDIAALTILKTNKTYFPSEFQYTAVVDGGKFWGNIKKIATTCDKHPRIVNEKCTKLALNPTDYELLPNGSIKVSSFAEYPMAELPSEIPPIKSIFNKSEFEYKNRTGWGSDLGNDSTILICFPENLNETLRKLELWKKVEIKRSCSALQKFGIASTVIGFICSALSMVGMVLVLITYSIFKTLRTLPGISLMNLTVAVMLSQLLFVTGILLPADSLRPEYVCFSVAVMTHYCTLASFMWMNVMAFTSYRAFGANLKIRLLQLTKRHIVLNSMYGWGIPAVIVTIAAAVDYIYRAEKLIGYGVVSAVTVTEDKNLSTGDVENIKIHYKTMANCWIGNSKATLVLFGVPLIYSMTVNLTLFIKTCLGMRGKNGPVHFLRRESRSGNITDKNDMCIQIRLSAQYGFAWIFAIIIIIFGTSKAESTGMCYALYILNLIFTVMNGCTGLFIFLAFMCNRRIYHLYKSRFIKSTKQRAHSAVFATNSSKATSSAAISDCSPPASPIGNFTPIGNFN